MGEKDEGGGFAGLLGKAEQWLKDQGVTHEELEKAKARQEAWDAQGAAEDKAEQRADRSARVGDSRVTLTGTVNATVDSGLAAQTEREGDQLFITVEAVDPIPVEGGTFAGFSYGIPGYTGPGTYDLGTADLSGLTYELMLDRGGEGFYWAPEYGPGIVTVSSDEKTMDVHFVFQDPGSNKVDLQGTVRLA
jgi:hypothetical protein